MPDANVRVVCRFRPTNEREKRENVAAKQADGLTLDVLDAHTVQVVGPGSKEVLTFSFDYVFGENSAQRQVYEVTARDTVLDMLDGYNGTIFAYGQTGAGKSYTMTSNLDGTPETRGIIPRACSQLFSHIEQDNSGTEFTIKCSFLEIYKETLRDLLDPKSATKLKIRETPTKGVWVEGLTEAFVSSQQDIFTLLRLGEQSRTTAATNMNSVSSRSHSLFVVTLVQKLKDGSTKTSRLNLADLAGSEKVGKTGATGETLEEAKKINQSLSALGNCIVALSKSPEKRKHVPYRDSKLSFILRESLGGNSKTTLMIACSPHLYNLEETISTLRFGQRAKAIKNQVKINAHRSVQELEMIVTKLQAEVSRLRAYTRTLEQELITRLPNETVDLQALQEKAWKTLKPEGEQKTEKSDAKPRPSTSHAPSANTLSPAVTIHATPTRGKRALSGSMDSAQMLAPAPRPRSRADSERVEHSSSPSSSLSFLTDSVSDGTRSPPSESDSDFWAPMNLVEAQIAYDRMKEELEFKLQDALEELAMAKDENGIESLKSQIRAEFEEYKVQHDAKLVEVHQLSSELMSKITSATVQAEDLAEQLSQTAEQRDKAEADRAYLSAEKDTLLSELNSVQGKFKTLEEGKETDVSNLSRSLETMTSEKSALSAELVEIKSLLAKTQTDLEKKLAETETRLSTEKSTLTVSLAEQQAIVATKSKQLEDVSANVVRLTSDLEHAVETRGLLKTQVESLRLEVESLRASVNAKDGQLLDATSSVQKLESKMQDYIAEASGEGLKVLGDLNKSLTEKNQQLFEEKNALMAKSSEAQLKLDIALSELEAKKEQKATDNARLSALESDLVALKSELEQTKLAGAKRSHELELRLETETAQVRSELEQERTASTRKSHSLEIQLKELEMAVVEEKRLTLQSQLAIEKSRVETEMARTDNVRIRAELEKEMTALGTKLTEEKRALEVAVASKTSLAASQAIELTQLGDLATSLKAQIADLDLKAERRSVESKFADESNMKRIQSLEEDLTDARVSLRRAREEAEILRDERLQLNSDLETLNAAHANAQSELASYALKTPSKPVHSSIVGRDPTQMLRSMDSHLKTPSLNSRIAVPVSHSLMSQAYSSSGGSGVASGMLKNGSNGNVSANVARPAQVASSILNTPSLNNSSSERSKELGAWLNVCTCIGGKATHSSGWRRLWVVVKDRKVVCYENQEQRTIVEAVQLRGCQIWQLPDVTRTLVEQPSDFAFVLISNPDDLSAALDAADGDEAGSAMQELQQDEFAFAAPSRELLDSFVQNLIKMDCEPLAFTTLRLESILPAPVQLKPATPAAASSPAANTTPKHASAFSKLGASSAATQATPSAPKSFLSGLFG